MRRVLLDCDGVLADFIGGVCDTIREIDGGDFHPHHVTEFNFAKCLSAHGLSESATKEVKRIISDREGWWSRLRPLPGAKDGVLNLMGAADVYIVTSPWNSCRTWLHEREDWLRHHFGIPHHKVLVGSAKHIVTGHVFVDDKTETLETWRDHNTGIAVQWATPHNRLDPWNGISTADWDVVRSLVSR